MFMPACGEVPLGRAMRISSWRRSGSEMVDHPIAVSAGPTPRTVRRRVVSPAEADAFHRAHARVELAIRDIKAHAGLSHCPSGNFFANAAWLACTVLAHNLYRWTERHTSPVGQLTNGNTVRTRLFRLPGRIVNYGGRHLPHHTLQIRPDTPTRPGKPRKLRPKTPTQIKTVDSSLGGVVLFVQRTLGRDWRRTGRRRRLLSACVRGCHRR